MLLSWSLQSPGLRSKRHFTPLFSVCFPCLISYAHHELSFCPMLKGICILKKKNGAMHWTPRARGSSHHAEGIDALISREPASGSAGFPSTFPGPCHHTKSNILTPKKPVTSTQARSKPEGDLSGFDKLLATSRRKSKLPRLAKTAWNKRNTKGGEFARPDVKAYYKVILINIMWY